MSPRIETFDGAKNINISLHDGGSLERIIVYRMVRLCGGAHEISGTEAPLFLHGWGKGWWSRGWWGRWWGRGGWLGRGWWGG